MPCWEERVQSVDIQNVNRPILIEALEADGWTIDSSTETTVTAHKEGVTFRWNKSAGCEVRGSSSYRNTELANGVVRSYTGTAFAQSMRRRGFKVYKEGNKYVAERRKREYATVRR